MTVVIDCNIFVMCLTSRSPYHLIYTSLIQGKFNLVVSSEILLEYQEIVEAKYSSSTANAFISLLKELPNVYFCTAYYNWRLIGFDEDDNKYVDCAIAGRANYLVSEDRHFRILKTIDFPKVPLLSIDEFVRMLSLNINEAGK
ncbi:MAG: putative toxin-antitoxin system toxin component, PIN family [Agriterribacter sp.]